MTYLGFHVGWDSKFLCLFTPEPMFHCRLGDVSYTTTSGQSMVIEVNNCWEFQVWLNVSRTISSSSTSHIVKFYCRTPL